jgi:hypothetical protein
MFVCSQVCRPEVTFHFTTFYWMTAFLTMMLCFKDGTSRVFCRGFFPHEIYKIIEKYKVILSTAGIVCFTVVFQGDDSVYSAHLDVHSDKLRALHEVRHIYR